jgi:hypothetical protein
MTSLLLALTILLRVGVPLPLWGPILMAADTPEEVALLAVTAEEETGGSWDCAAVGDYGRSYSCFQVMVFGETRQRVQSEPYFAAWLALNRIRSSLRRCGGLEEYLRGDCRALKQAKRRLNRARSLYQ